MQKVNHKVIDGNLFLVIPKEGAWEDHVYDASEDKPLDVIGNPHEKDVMYAGIITEFNFEVVNEYNFSHKDENYLYFEYD